MRVKAQVRNIMRHRHAQNVRTTGIDTHKGGQTSTLAKIYMLGDQDTHLTGHSMLPPCRMRSRRPRAALSTHKSSNQHLSPAPDLRWYVVVDLQHRPAQGWRPRLRIAVEQGDGGLVRFYRGGERHGKVHDREDLAAQRLQPLGCDEKCMLVVVRELAKRLFVLPLACEQRALPEVAQSRLQFQGLGLHEQVGDAPVVKNVDIRLVADHVVADERTLLYGLGQED
mmetsp:Transcript_25779/g.81240  ORF Transcript_25779/g.81240 Transcript_25779/m.81240 type:complete len:225 (+) Transcript_25779:33-707(+)